MTKARLALTLLVTAFVIKEADMIRAAGKAPLDHADGVSEVNSRSGALFYQEEGPFRTWGLPKYQGYVYDTPVEEIKNSFIYTHYLPGPDYIQWFGYSLFGNTWEGVQLTRFIPLLHILLSVLFLSLVCEKYIFKNWQWGTFWLAGFLFWVPAMTWWVLNLHGHAFSTSYLLTLMGLGILGAQNPSTRNRRLIYTATFVLGFLSMQMLMTAAFVTAAAPIAGAYLASTEHKGWKLGFTAGLGLVFAFVLHFFQIAALFGLDAAWKDQILTAIDRGVDHGPPTRLMLIGQYSDHVWRFFRVGALSMVTSGLFAIWLHRHTPRSFIYALFVAVFAGYGWIMVMKHHSVIHTHVNPRIFFVLYATWIIILVHLAYEKVNLRRNGVTS